jgi:glycosyltransferase involved in cell wall biosynthesis
MRASVVIATRNRKNELRRAVASVVKQTDPVEVIVIDDGSTDGTSEMVASEFPQVRLDRTEMARGQAAQRNRGGLLASANIIFSIDDDAEFSTPHIVSKTLAQFCHPRVAAVAIPYVEPHKSEQEFQKAPDGNGLWIADSFRGTAYAIRRDIFLELNGYREEILVQNEEPDFCIRLLDSGLIVALGLGDTILHHESLKRDWRRQDFYGRQNDILFAWRNVPMPCLPIHLVATTLNGLAHAIATKSLSDVRGIVSGYSQMLFRRHCRQPVTRATYRLHRLLKKKGPKPLAEVEPLLPPMPLSPMRQQTADPPV